LVDHGCRASQLSGSRSCSGLGLALRRARALRRMLARRHVQHGPEGPDELDTIDRVGDGQLGRGPDAEAVLQEREEVAGRGFELM
jgi:hypothetical protein